MRARWIHLSKFAPKWTFPLIYLTNCLWALRHKREPTHASKATQLRSKRQMTRHQKENLLGLLTQTVQPLVADSPQRFFRLRLVRLREGSQCTEVPSTRSSRKYLISSVGFGKNTAIDILKSACISLEFNQSISQWNFRKCLLMTRYWLLRLLKTHLFFFFKFDFSHNEIA